MADLPQVGPRPFAGGHAGRRINGVGGHGALEREEEAVHYRHGQIARRPVGASALQFGQGSQDPSMGGKLLFADIWAVNPPKVPFGIGFGGPLGEEIIQMHGFATRGLGEQHPGQQRSSLDIARPLLMGPLTLEDGWRLVRSFLQTVVIAEEAGLQIICRGTVSKFSEELHLDYMGMTLRGPDCRVRMGGGGVFLKVCMKFPRR